MNEKYFNKIHVTLVIISEFQLRNPDNTRKGIQFKHTKPENYFY